MVFDLSFEQVCPKGAYLAKVYPRYPYVNGIRGSEIAGYNYIIASRNGFDKIVVKTPDTVPKISQEQLEAATDDISVSFKGFVGKIYNSDGKIGISATAEEVILL